MRAEGEDPVKDPDRRLHRAPAGRILRPFASANVVRGGRHRTSAGL